MELGSVEDLSGSLSLQDLGGEQQDLTTGEEDDDYFAAGSGVDYIENGLNGSAIFIRIFWTDWRSIWNLPYRGFHPGYRTSKFIG